MQSLCYVYAVLQLNTCAILSFTSHDRMSWQEKGLSRRGRQELQDGHLLCSQPASWQQQQQQQPDQV